MPCTSHQPGPIEQLAMAAKNVKSLLKTNIPSCPNHDSIIDELNRVTRLLCYVIHCVQLVNDAKTKDTIANGEYGDELANWYSKHDKDDEVRLLEKLRSLELDDVELKKMKNIIIKLLFINKEKQNAII